MTWGGRNARCAGSPIRSSLWATRRLESPQLTSSCGGAFSSSLYTSPSMVMIMKVSSAGSLDTFMSARSSCHSSWSKR